MLPVSLRQVCAAACGAVFLSTTALAQVPDVDPPRTSIEDTRERYRASRAADKPRAETAADVVEVGEGEPPRRIEPVDPTNDPSTDEHAIVGAPQNPTLHRPLPLGFERLELAPEIRSELVVVVKDYDTRVSALLKRFRAVHADAVALEAAALADRAAGGDIVVVEVPTERRAGYRGDVEVAAAVLPVAAITADSPYSEASAAAWEELRALHLKLVRIEAEKLQALEKRLSPEQVEVIRRYRVETRPAPVPVRQAVPVRPARPVRGEVDVQEGSLKIEGRRGTEIEIESNPRKAEVEIETDE